MLWLIFLEAPTPKKKITRYNIDTSNVHVRTQVNLSLTLNRNEKVNIQKRRPPNPFQKIPTVQYIVRLDTLCI